MKKMDILKTAFILGLLITSYSCNAGEKETAEIPANQDTSAKNEFQKLPKEGEIKVMSFNVRVYTTEADVRNHWDNRKDACVNLIKDQQPSVIGLQEAEYTKQWSYLKEQLADEYDGFGVGRDNGEQKGEVMGILYRKSKIEKIDGGTFWLSETPDVVSKGWDAGYRRTATWGIFKEKATGTYFCYMNTHLDLVPNARTQEMKLIAEKFKQLNPNHYVQFLTADFNTKANDAIFDEVRQTMDNAREKAPAGLTDQLNTYNGYGKSGDLIDDIFYSNQLKVIEYHTITDYYRVPYVTDHYPIYAIFKK